MATKLERMQKNIPSLYKPLANTYISALLTAWASSDSTIETQITEAKNQLYTALASGSYLDSLGDNLGVDRPSGLIDTDFRELIPILSFYPKQIRRSIYDLMDVFWGYQYSRANITCLESDNYNFGISSTLTGTLTFTAEQKKVTGSGTSFTTEISVGDYIKYNTHDNIEFKRVGSIESNTVLYLSDEYNYSISGTSDVYTPSNLTYMIDGSTTEYKIIFRPTYFSSLTAITASEVVIAINTEAVQYTINAQENSYPVEDENFINIETDTPGSTGSIQVTGGTANEFSYFSADGNNNYIFVTNADGTQYSATDSAVIGSNTQDQIIRTISAVDVDTPTAGTTRLTVSGTAILGNYLLDEEAYLYTENLLGFPTQIQNITDLSRKTVLYEINHNELVANIPSIVPFKMDSLKGNCHIHTNYSGEIIAVDNVNKIVTVNFDDPVVLNYHAGLTFSQNGHNYTIVSHTAGQYGVEITFAATDDLTYLSSGEPFEKIELTFNGQLMPRYSWANLTDGVYYVERDLNILDLDRNFSSSNYEVGIKKLALPILYQAYAQTDNTGTTDNKNCSVSVVGGKTRLTLDWLYTTGLNAGEPFGDLIVLFNGKEVPRFVAGNTTDGVYYTEIDTTTIEFDADYSGSEYEFGVLRYNASYLEEQAYCQTDNVGAGSNINCSTSTVGGKTRITLSGWTYTVDKHTDYAFGNLKVTFDGKEIPREIPRLVVSSNPYYVEIANNIIELDTDYTLIPFEFAVKIPNNTITQQAFGYTNNIGILGNANCTISVVGGVTRVVFDWTYTTGVDAGEAYGDLKVLVDGKEIPRFVGAGTTDGAYYTEIDNVTIDLDQDYSGSLIAFEAKKLTSYSSDQSYCQTDNIGAGGNLDATVSVVGGKTRIAFGTWTYTTAVNPGDAHGDLIVLFNGQEIPRFVAGNTTDGPYYTEISTSVIELDTDYSASAIEVGIRNLSSQITSKAYGQTDNVGAVGNLDSAISLVDGKTRITLTAWNYTLATYDGEYFGQLEVYLNGQELPRAESHTVSPTQGTFYTEISNSVIDLDQDYSGYAYEVGIKKLGFDIDDQCYGATDKLGLYDNKDCIMSVENGVTRIETAFNYTDEIERTSHRGVGFYILDPNYVGTFIYDESGTYSVSSNRTHLAQDIEAGEVYPVITVDDASNIPNSEGYLIFDFGNGRQEQPVPYRGRPNNSTLLLDPAYVFTYNHYIENIINVVNTPLGPTNPDTYGDDYATYITSMEDVRVTVQTLISDIIAAGVSIRYVIDSPDYLFEF